MTDRPPDQPARPRSEPEIIPPRRYGPEEPAAIFIRIDENGGTRRYTLRRPGPFTVIFALAVLGLIAAIMLIVLLSVAVIWIPVVIVLIIAVMVSVTVRRYWWRFRSWLARQAR